MEDAAGAISGRCRYGGVHQDVDLGLLGDDVIGVDRGPKLELDCTAARRGSRPHGPKAQGPVAQARRGHSQTAAVSPGPSCQGSDWQCQNESGAAMPRPRLGAL